MASKLEKAREKAGKNNESFDEEAFCKEFIENSRFLKTYYKSKSALTK